ncbi:hypothetical protein ACFQMM_16175 [Saliphagus sp. GCM10025308]
MRSATTYGRIVLAADLERVIANAAPVRRRRPSQTERGRRSGDGGVGEERRIPFDERRADVDRRRQDDGGHVVNDRRSLPEREHARERRERRSDTNEAGTDPVDDDRSAFRRRNHRLSPGTPFAVPVGHDSRSVPGRVGPVGSVVVGTPNHSVARSAYSPMCS